MKITRKDSKRGLRHDVRPGMRPGLRIGLFVLTFICGALAWWISEGFETSSRSSISFTALAILAGALAIGEPVYSLWPGRGARGQLRILGVPVVSLSIKPEEIQSAEIIEDNGGSFSLRLLDAAGEARLTIEHFPSIEPAERLAGLFPTSQAKQRAGIRKSVDDIRVQSRELPILFQVTIITIMAVFTPAMVLLLGIERDETWFWISFGILVTVAAAYVVRRDNGTLRHSTELGFVDLWSRTGFFRITEYRQWLGEAPGQEILRVRRSRWPWIIPALILLEAGAVHQTLIWNEERVPPGLPPAPESKPPDPENLRRGAEVLTEFLRPGDSSESIPATPPEKAPPENE